MKNILVTFKRLLKTTDNYIHRHEKALSFVLLALSTSYFVYQHASGISWDFLSYVLNAKYLFSSGCYFEPLRPPLMPVLIGLFSVFSYSAAEYIYVILASFMLFYSSRRLAKALGFNALNFYALSLNITVLLLGLINGTELLSLVFLMLTIAAVLENKPVSGLFFALATLSRYSLVSFFPILLLHKGLRNNIKSIIFFVIAWLPWFAFNFMKWGNIFTSLSDQYANNILLRSYIKTPVLLTDFLSIGNLLLPFTILGLAMVVHIIFNDIKRLQKSTSRFLKKTKKLIEKNKASLIMLFILILTIQSYYSIPLKQIRYLFIFLLPAAYFSYFGIKLVSKHIRIPMSIIVIVIFAAPFLLLIISEIQDTNKFWQISSSPDKPEVYTQSIQKINDLEKVDCLISSNAWVMLNYYGLCAWDYPSKDLLNRSLSEGEIAVLFYNVPEPNYVHNKTFISSFPILHATNKYVILGYNESCTPIRLNDATYLQKTKKRIETVHKYSINTNPCVILFHDHPLVERTCNFINLNGFILDENRAIG